MQTIDALSTTLRSYLNAEQTNHVKRAYYYAEQAHYGQRRRSGEAYVTHPLAVAGILAEMHMDHQSLVAAMLHDVIEDTGIEKAAIGEQFGPTVAELVDGVSKLTQMEFKSLEEKQAENFQKMALAMAQDIRVILVKLADRLHNMRTLGVLQSGKARRIARETLDIYSPIAMRLGMNNIRMEFENLGFSALYPMRASRIDAALRGARGNRKELVEKIRHQIEATLEQEGHTVSVVGREKHLYSIYRKMKYKRKSFSEIMDIYAFRIIVDSVDTCYRVLGCIHSMYKPVPGEFKDYIAIPKANGYQSLHTVLKGMHGVPVEVQIRTREMEDMATNGIAAHWLYKSDEQSSNGSHARAREWVQGLLEMQQRAGNSLEFIESVKIDLFPDEIYVFTPKGHILELPRRATAVDFAYAVHTDVGNSCIACRINRRHAPLSEPLESGQTVEVLISASARPNPSWLDYAVTAKARSSIHHFLKNQTREDSVALGHNLLDRGLARFGSNLEQFPEGKLQEFLARQHYAHLDDLLTDVARGNRLPAITAQQLLSEPGSEATESESNDALASPMAICGTEGFMVSYARCCHPIPGDPIEGYLSSEKGMVVHRDQCNNLGDMRENSERLVALLWDDEVQGEYPIELRIEVDTRRGMIAVIATRINSMGVNIERIATDDKDYQFTFVTLEMPVQNRVHLAHIMKRLRTISHVRKVIRVKN
jgi:guanosine-3',5'-bis(diphosphate) 3'-pyrophosphohydrolase